MELTIRGTAKEIAALSRAAAGRHGTRTKARLVLKRARRRVRRTGNPAGLARRRRDG